MAQYEYKVVPAPTTGKKAKGLRTSADRFANALQSVMNELGKDGWEYVRADTLPSEERSGLTGRTTVYQNMLVFRRTAPDAEDKADISGLLAAPAPVPAAPPLSVGAASQPAPAVPAPEPAPAARSAALGPATAEGTAAPIGPATRGAPSVTPMAPPAPTRGTDVQPAAPVAPASQAATSGAELAPSPEATAAARAAAAALRSYHATRGTGDSGVAAE